MNAHGGMARWNESEQVEGKNGTRPTTFTCASTWSAEHIVG
jgi:hypothetical protein